MIFSEAIPETVYISKQPRNNTQKARSFLDLLIYNVKIPNDNLYIPVTQIYIDSVGRIKDNLAVTRVSGEIAGKSRRAHRYGSAALENQHSLAWQTRWENGKPLCQRPSPPARVGSQKQTERFSP
jgi:hypothetical protein